MIRVHTLIEGRVQGVWYRQSTLEQATALGLSGWVRNLRSGAVEAVFEGPPETVERMVAWCRRGPPDAVVTRVTATEGPVEDLSSPFQIRPTA